jgi:8-hydroxy-5-deazaflavin:NADPH oxidoreductase
VRIGVLGTGAVGTTIGTKLASLGHEVAMGARSPGNEVAAGWAAKTGGRAGTFAEAAAESEVLFNCTSGAHSLEALQAAGEENLAGRLLIDVANPLKFGHGPLPALTLPSTDSLGERIQEAFAEARVVKALNTVNCAVMVDPASVPGEHVVFVCGNDESAKAETSRLLGELGWPVGRIIDLGPITAARATEMYLPLWVALMGTVGTARFNIEIRS